MMAQLPHNTPTVTALPNGWTQVRFTLTTPFTLEVGARLTWQDVTLAPWRVQDAHIECLCLANTDLLLATPESTMDAAIELIHAGQSLPHIDAHQPLLITGEGLGVADALRAAGQLKTLAAQSLVLLSATSFPCVIKPARFMVASLPNAIAACPLLEDWGFANRLIHPELPGCISGSIDQLTQQPCFSALQKLSFSD